MRTARPKPGPQIQHEGRMYVDAKNGTTPTPSLKEMALAVEEALDEAIAGAEMMKNRVDTILKGLGPVPVRKIRDSYEMAEAASNAIGRTLAILLKAKAEGIEDKFDGIRIYEWPAIQDLEAEPEDEETAGDRRYHEAKDEGKL